MIQRNNYEANPAHRARLRAFDLIQLTRTVPEPVLEELQYWRLQEDIADREHAAELSALENYLQEIASDADTRYNDLRDALSKVLSENAKEGYTAP